MRRERPLGVTVAVLAAMLGLAATAAGERGGQGPLQDRLARPGVWDIVGTWIVQIRLASCETEEEFGPMFPGLNTFLAGGSMLSDPAASPAMLRTGHGVWAHDGGRRFTNTVLLFRFNPDGSYAGTQTVRRNITVSRDGDSFTAHDTVTIADIAGTIVDTRCAVGRGNRLEP